VCGLRRKEEPTGRQAAIVAAVLVGWTAACARQGAPPGGPPDQRPPVVVATYPEPFGTLEDLDASVRFEFDERISERSGGGSLADAVTISPRGGEVRVDHSRRGLTVQVEGGFRPGVVYRVTLNPVISDLFGNALTDPFELVFTTGGEPTPTTLAGEVWDRITGRPGEGVVHAIGEDSLIHQATAGRDGIYAFRYLPAGRFRVVAFVDVNRDGDPDSTEVQGTLTAELGAGDTLFVDVPVLAPDTLPAVVAGAEALDSITVAITLDDFLDPASPVDAAMASLSREEGEAPGIASLLSAADYTAYVTAVADSFARLDSLDRAEAAARAAEAAGDTAALDSAGVADTAVVEPVEPPPDTVVQPVEAVEPPAPPDTALADPDVNPQVALGPDTVRPPPGRPTPVALPPLAGATPGPVEGTSRVLPGRRLVALLDAPLERDVEYTVRVSSLVNINGLRDGGGEAVFVLETAPDTAVADTLPPPDTGSVGPGSGEREPIDPGELFGRR
jgi:hypothetical protein